jgi:hypothetical protein
LLQPPPPRFALSTFNPPHQLAVQGPLAALLGQRHPVSHLPLSASPAAASGGGGELFAVRALYDCVGERAGELTFRAGELISVTAGGPGDDWWEGRVDCSSEGADLVPTGLFPCNYVSQSRVFRR